VRTEVVGEKGSAFIGLDQNLQVKTTDGRWGGQITANFFERFGQAYDTELQRWVNAATAGTIDGAGAWDGFAAVAVCEAGVQAIRSGQRVPVRLDGGVSAPQPTAGWVGGQADWNVDEDAEPDIHAPDLIGDRP
jgi:myo-inositol 2-dehydrogenase/D-chiro-inositol 1-dehydrogenase